MLSPEYRPLFPSGYRPGIGIVGCGGIVKLAHLPAYEKYGVDVVGVYDPDPEATRGVSAGRVFESLDDLLADPAVEVVDVATPPQVRVEIVRMALEAGKHVLAQKPFALDVRSARGLVDEADRRGLTLAVNQNGRWAPPWRIATLLVEERVIGDVVAVTHLFDHDFRFVLGTRADGIDHMVLYDFSVHWFDITRCWLADKTVETVRACEYRTPNQPPESKSPWGAWAVIEYHDGSTAVIRGVGSAETDRPGNPFWVHGSEGTIRGSVRRGSDFLEVERNGASSRYDLVGEWMPDGFAGAIGELFSAIADDREPFNSARHNLLSLQMTLAACRSAEEGGRPITLDEVL